jgi:hypothetical protein
MMNEGYCEYEVEEMVHIVNCTINITPHPSLLIFKSRIHSLTSISHKGRSLYSSPLLPIPSTTHTLFNSPPLIPSTEDFSPSHQSHMHSPLSKNKRNCVGRMRRKVPERGGGVYAFFGALCTIPLPLYPSDEMPEMGSEFWFCGRLG